MENLLKYLKYMSFFNIIPLFDIKLVLFYIYTFKKTYVNTIVYVIMRDLQYPYDF